MKENERDTKRALATERETVKEINLGLLERLEVSEAEVNNFSGFWAPNSLIFHKKEGPKGFSVIHPSP